MITINSLRNLERFGIFPLTGEADNLAYRMLCDVSQRGKDLLREVYGMEANSPPANIQTNGEKHVASVMLSYRAWQDIGPVGLVISSQHIDRPYHCCHTVFAVDNGTIFGMESQEVFKQAVYDWDADPNRSDNEKPPLLAPATYSCDNGNTWHQWPTSYGELDRFYSQAHEQPHIGSKNVHAFSGQVFG